MTWGEEQWEREQGRARSAPSRLWPFLVGAGVGAALMWLYTSISEEPTVQRQVTSTVPPGPPVTIPPRILVGGQCVEGLNLDTRERIPCAPTSPG